MWLTLEKGIVVLSDPLDLLLYLEMVTSSHHQLKRLKRFKVLSKSMGSRQVSICEDQRTSHKTSNPPRLTEQISSCSLSLPNVPLPQDHPVVADHLSHDHRLLQWNVSGKSRHVVVVILYGTEISMQLGTLVSSFITSETPTLDPSVLVLLKQESWILLMQLLSILLKYPLVSRWILMMTWIWISSQYFFVFGAP